MKRLKVGMVSPFHQHSMFKKVERVTAQTGCTSCTKWTISFEVSGFRTKTHLLQKAFNFFTCCSDILDQRHHHNSCGEKVFTFSSLVSFAYCAVTISTFFHMLCGSNDDTMPTFNLFRVHLKCFSILWSYSSK